MFAPVVGREPVATALGVDGVDEGAVGVAVTVMFAESDLPSRRSWFPTT